MTPPEIVLLLGITALVLASFLLIVTYITYRVTFMRRRVGEADPYKNVDNPEYSDYREYIVSLIERISGEPYEDIYITSADGLRLRARLYHRDPKAPICMMVHGYKSSPLRDCSGGAVDALDMGYNLLLIDQRASGLSEGKTITFGIKERYDILLWIDELVRRYGEDCKIVLTGTSMGGASVLMASGLPLPRNVRAVLADCPYSSPREIILSVAGKLGYPAFVYPLIRLGAIIYGGFDPEVAVLSSKTPIIIMHGDSDNFVPLMMSEKIGEGASVPVRHETFSGASHCMCYIMHPKRYREIREAFYAEYLGD